MLNIKTEFKVVKAPTLLFPLTDFSAQKIILILHSFSCCPKRTVSVDYNLGL